jgi:DNA-binding response OmpR family regulator
MTEAPTALVVEDDLDLGPCIHEILEEGGYRTVLARSLAQARAELANHGFDIIVLDVMLGGDHARDLLAELAVAPEAPPTLLVSAAREAASLAESYGVSLVPKPFDMDVFLAQVARVRRRSAA